MSGFDVTKRLSVLALSPEQSGIHVGSDINSKWRKRMITASKVSEILRLGKPVWIMDIKINKDVVDEVSTQKN